MELITVFNIVCLLLVTGLLAYAVVDYNIKDGVIIKVGLIFAIGGAMATIGSLVSESVLFANRALFLVNIGIFIVVFGYWLRVRRARSQKRRSSDWLCVHRDDLHEYDGPEPFTPPLHR